MLLRCYSHLVAECNLQIRTSSSGRRQQPAITKVHVRPHAWPSQTHHPLFLHSTHLDRVIQYETVFTRYRIKYDGPRACVPRKHPLHIHQRKCSSVKIVIIVNAVNSFVCHHTTSDTWQSCTAYVNTDPLYLNKFTKPSRGHRSRTAPLAHVLHHYNFPLKRIIQNGTCSPYICDRCHQPSVLCLRRLNYHKCWHCQSRLPLIPRGGQPRYHNMSPLYLSLHALDLNVLLLCSSSSRCSFPWRQFRSSAFILACSWESSSHSSTLCVILPRITSMFRFMPL